MISSSLPFGKVRSWQTLFLLQCRRLQQFKDFTAREMGLRVDDEVDERMNIVSASQLLRVISSSVTTTSITGFCLAVVSDGAGGCDARAVGEGNLGTRHMEITPTRTGTCANKAHKVAFEGAVSTETDIAG